MKTHHVRAEIRDGDAWLEGDLHYADDPAGFVLMPHVGVAAVRSESRDALVARALNDAGLGTLHFCVLTHAEERYGTLRANVKLLTERLEFATAWLHERIEAQALPLAYCATATAAAAAIRAAAALPRHICAVVVRSGRPDLAGAEPLRNLRCPTLLMLGSRDADGLTPNRQALALMQCPKALEIVPNASALFEEPGTLEQATRLIADWIGRAALAQRRDAIAAG